MVARTYQRKGEENRFEQGRKGAERPKITIILKYNESVTYLDKETNITFT